MKDLIANSVIHAGIDVLRISYQVKTQTKKKKKKYKIKYKIQKKIKLQNKKENKLKIIKGRNYFASLTESGSIEFQDPRDRTVRKFETLSSWSIFCKRIINPNRQGTTKKKKKKQYKRSEE